MKSISSIIKIYLVRIFLITITHYFIKAYDESFASMWTYDIRGISYHLLYIIYGLLLWELANFVFRIINNLLPKRFDLSQKMISSGGALIIIGLLGSMFYTVIYYNIEKYIFNGSEFWGEFRLYDDDLTFALFLFYVLFLAIFGVKYYFNHYRKAELISEMLKKEMIQSKFDALKNQIEPHFFFNSLSVLTSLVYKDADLSAEYITQLSKLYRYILDQKDQLLVPLYKELNMLVSYMFLINIRHSNDIKFNIKLKDSTKKECFIPQNTLHLLAENAIKHNKFTEENPLKIIITEDDNNLIITNNLNRRVLLERSSGIGLENIQKRYELLGEFNTKIIETGQFFVVKLPKLTKEHDEGINI